MVGKTKKIYDLKFSKKEDLYEASKIKDNLFHGENFYMRTSKRNYEPIKTFNKFQNTTHFKNSNEYGVKEKKTIPELIPRRQTFPVKKESYINRNYDNQKKEVKDPKPNVEYIKKESDKKETFKKNFGNNNSYNKDLEKANIKMEIGNKKKTNSVFVSKNPFEVLGTVEDDDDNEYESED
jgi:hypothetical protein